MSSKPISFFTLFLLISFASVNAVLFTPALPEITRFFHITADDSQKTMTWFLIGYTLGQLGYGPFADRYGRKVALYIGITLQIFSSLGCVFATNIHSYEFLIHSRFFLAVGSGVGLKMAFTLLNESYPQKQANQKVALLMLGFAVTPGLSVAVGGLLNKYNGFISCFYATAFYGVFMLLLILKIPETLSEKDFNALKFRHLIHGYTEQFKNLQLCVGGLLMGLSAAIIYLFASVAPFVAMTLIGMSSENYGLANALPAFGLVMGSLLSAYLIDHYGANRLIQVGILIVWIGSMALFKLMQMPFFGAAALFLPMIVIYLGLSLIQPNASILALSRAQDKAHGAAVMSFLNMLTCTLAVLWVQHLPITALLLPHLYLMIAACMVIMYFSLRLTSKK